MAILDLFPTPISITEVSLMPNDLEKLMAIYDNKDNWSLGGSGNYNSIETDIFRNILGNNSNLYNKIQNEINLFTSNILGEEPTLKTTQSWLNFNPTGTKHDIHSHSNSIVSGIFYLRTNDKTGNLNFHKPGGKSNLIENEIKTFNKYNFEWMFFYSCFWSTFFIPKLFASFSRN